MSLMGKLRVPNLVGVIQFVCLERVTARLRLQEGERVGGIYFAGGEAVHAEYEGLEGDSAFERILSVEGGAFELEYGVTPPRRTITRPAQALLLDLFRRRDDAQRALNNGLGTLTRALIDPGLARGLILVEKDGTILTEQRMANPESCARLIAKLVREAEAIGAPLGLGAIQRAWVHSSDGRCFVVFPYGQRWVGIQAEGGPGGRRLGTALDRILGADGRGRGEE